MIVAVQAVGGRGASEAFAIVVSIARHFRSVVKASAVVRAEAAESLSQNAPAAALVGRTLVSSVRMSMLVVIKHRHQVNYLVANDRRVIFADRFDVSRQVLALRHVLVEPPQGLLRVHDALFVCKKNN